jgi:thioredoxin-disulfide reductase
MMYDLIIIGGASAGLTSAIYAARKKLNTIILTEKIGGQSLLTDNIENYPGFKLISGLELIKKMREQVEALGVEIKEGEKINTLRNTNDGFEAETEKGGEVFRARSLIIASGKKPRLLNVPGEKELTGKGVSYCSICDAPLFSGKDVVVVGGGNAGLESAMDLTKYANKIYVLEFMPKLAGDESTQEKLRQTGKVEFITNVATKEIKGKDFVEALVYEDRQTKERKELKAGGVFVNIGQIPSSDFVKDFLELNNQKEIVIDSKTNQTSVEGVFAAGDVTDIAYKQCIIAAAEGAKAALSAYNYLLRFR